MLVPRVRRLRLRPGLVAGIAIALTSLATLAVADAAVLQVTGMTFVSSHDSVREIIVRSLHAKFHTDTKVAELDGVQAELSEGDRGRSFSMTCKRAELDLEKNDFLAQGDVKGET